MKIGNLEDDLKSVVGAKVATTDRNSIVFDNGITIDFHPYETYVSNPSIGVYGGNENVITIYSDGGCRNNQSNSNIGGWGAVIEREGVTRELYGSSRNTTNNIQELTGVIRALEALDTTHIPVTVYSDSAYVVNGITMWCDNWVSKGWIKSDKKPVLNKELWQRLLELKNKQENITFCKVKGHSDNIGNNLADNLVNKAMDELEEMNNE